MSARIRLRAILALRALFSGPSASPPARSDWPLVARFAMQHLVVSSVWREVTRRELDLPYEVRYELREWQRAAIARNLQLRRQLLEGVAALNRAGVIPVLLDGAHQLSDRTLGALEGCSISRLDLLVRPAELVTAIATLEGLGYRRDHGEASPPSRRVPLLRAGAGGVLQLHVEGGSSLATRVLPTAAVWEASLGMPFDGSQARVPAPTHEVLRRVLDAAGLDHNRSAGGLRLPQLLALAEIARARSAAIEWEEISRRMGEHGLEVELRSRLWLAHEVGGLPLPPGRSGVRARGRGARVLAGFVLDWPPERLLGRGRRPREEPQDVNPRPRVS